MQVTEQQLVSNEQLENSDCPSSDPNSRRQSDELETDGCVPEPANMAPDPGQHRSTTKCSLQTTRSSQSLDVAITVEVCDDDDDPQKLDADNDARPGTPYRTCLINIPPVTISSHISPPDDEPADRKCVIAMMSPTSVLSSPGTHSCSGSNPNFLSVSRTGTFSSGGSSRSCSRRQSSRTSVAEPPDIISVDNAYRGLS